MSHQIHSISKIPATPSTPATPGYSESLIDKVRRGARPPATSRAGVFISSRRAPNLTTAISKHLLEILGIDGRRADYVAVFLNDDGILFERVKPDTLGSARYKVDPYSNGIVCRSLHAKLREVTGLHEGDALPRIQADEIDLDQGAAAFLFSSIRKSFGIGGREG